MSFLIWTTEKNYQIDERLQGVIGEDFVKKAKELGYYVVEFNAPLYTVSEQIALLDHNFEPWFGVQYLKVTTSFMGQSVMISQLAFTRLSDAVFVKLAVQT